MQNSERPSWRHRHGNYKPAGATLKRGIDSPDRLRAFFALKGHKFLPIHLAEVIGMDLPSRAEFIDMAYMQELVDAPSGAVPDDGYRSRLQNMGFGGYLLIPIDHLIQDVDLERLQRYQAWFMRYRESRAGRWEPHVTEACDCTKKTGVPLEGCKQCDGTGELSILVEMSQLEEMLAEGIPWDQIPEEVR